ncbi:helix-turn-helix domain-containing protein [Streptomyces griseorubiginosus]|uniref:helix-turn-helix domain-containing protein n=1 Tax=Streptomyces griseorubiginosus TaxID=67304 RepID=UPI0036E3A7B2
MTDHETEAGAFKFEPAVPPQGPLLSINEIVSYNLMRARRSNAWTQQDVADLLEKYTGRTWSNASVSAAERAWQGGRPRKFDANELVALSKIFDVPVGYFFLPPEDEMANKWVTMKKFEDGEPPQGPDALDRHDFMALMPTASLLEYVGAHVSDLDYIARMKRLVKRYLGLDWRPSAWTVLVHTNPATGAVEFGMTPDERDRAEEPEWTGSTLQKPAITWPLPDHLKEAEETVGGNEVLSEVDSWRRVLEERISRVVEEKIREATSDIVESIAKDMAALTDRSDKSE